MASDRHLEAGQTALLAARWEAARASFEASLAQRETPEALEGLGTALWWLCDARESVRSRERAFTLFRERGERARACAVAIDLVITYLINLGNAAAARGWLGRGERIGRELKPTPLHGWLWLMRGYLDGDPEAARRLLQRALDLGRELGDLDLELVALGDLGLNRVVAGSTDEGMALLDEAMAGSMGEQRRKLETVVYNGCSMLAACHLAGDLERATQWCRIIDDFIREYSCPFLFGRCRVHYGSLLVTKGRWEHAEGELRAALGLAEDVGPGVKAEALGRLAELRLRQGRLEEAEELLAGCDDAGIAALPEAELRLAQHDPAAAITFLERRLGRLRGNVPDAAPVLGLLIEAHIASGDLDRAAEVAARLDVLDRETGSSHVHALAKLASGRLMAARTTWDDAIVLLEEALEAFSAIELPFETARVRFELARAFAEKQPAASAAEARSALRGFERMGATAYSDQAAALLRSLGHKVRREVDTTTNLTRREREVLQLVVLGLSNPEIAARLFISRKTASHHVSNLLMKLGMKNRAELVAYATRKEALTPGSKVPPSQSRFPWSNDDPPTRTRDG